jgi:hypothetical protein
MRYPKTIGFTCSNDLHEWLATKAGRSGTTISATVRTLLTNVKVEAEETEQRMSLLPTMPSSNHRR